MPSASTIFIAYEVLRSHEAARAGRAEPSHNHVQGAPLTRADRASEAMQALEPLMAEELERELARV